MVNGYDGKWRHYRVIVRWGDSTTFCAVLIWLDSRDYVNYHMQWEICLCSVTVVDCAALDEIHWAAEARRHRRQRRLLLAHRWSPLAAAARREIFWKNEMLRHELRGGCDAAGRQAGKHVVDEARRRV